MESKPKPGIVDISKETPYGLFKLQALRSEYTGFGVQVAVYKKYAGVMAHVALLQENWFKNILVFVEPSDSGEATYKIILGPFPDMPTAESYKKHALQKGMKECFLVNLNTIKPAK